MEMLTGRPPFFGLNSEAAIFAVGNNNEFTLPDCSEQAKNFLELCFTR